MASDNSVEEMLGGSIEEAIVIWDKRLRPPIELGPGATITNLDKYLRGAQVFGRPKARHIKAIGDWLREKGNRG